MWTFVIILMLTNGHHLMIRGLTTDTFSACMLARQAELDRVAQRDDLRGLFVTQCHDAEIEV